MMGTTTRRLGGLPAQPCRCVRRGPALRPPQPFPPQVSLPPRWHRRTQTAALFKDSSSDKSPETKEDTYRRLLRFGVRPEHISSGKAGRQSTSNNDLWGRHLYQYFNWRQGTSYDLLVTLLSFFGFVLFAGALRHWAVDGAVERAAGNLWADIYQVCQWVFGQEFPSADAPLSQQVMSVVTAMVGLAAFAMVLALVEQVVQEAFEANVKHGSQVYEDQHILVLGWCVSQRDVEVVRKVVEQLCLANAPRGGTTVVVLTQRKKQDMENIFRDFLPESKRGSTKLVFRQGSPLVPTDLRLVGARNAAATIVVSDQSRNAAEADAQSIRCAILLDSLDDAMGPQHSPESLISAAAAEASHQAVEELDLAVKGRHVVVELKTASSLPLLKYACGSRVMALSTGQLNAQRLAKMVKRPVMSIISQQLFNFQNGVSLYVQKYPQLVGTRFGELAHLFPDGIVMGLVDTTTGAARMAPSKDYCVQPNHALVVCRSTTVDVYNPLPCPPSEAELRVKEALAGWAPPTDSSLHEHDASWQLDSTPTASLLGAVGAVQASSAAATASAALATVTDAGAESGLGSSSSRYSGRQPLLVGSASWSSAVSQVELLKQQVAATSRRPSAVGGVESGTAGPGTQSADSAGKSNNIVPGPQFGSGQAPGMRERLQPSLAGSAQVEAGQVSSSSMGPGLAVAGRASTAALTAALATAIDTRSGSTAAPARQGMLDLSEFLHTLSQQPAGSSGSGAAPAGPSTDSPTHGHGPTPARSRGLTGSNSSSSTGGSSPGPRRAEWPVLSGAPRHSTTPRRRQFGKHWSHWLKTFLGGVQQSSAGSGNAGVRPWVFPTFSQPGPEAGGAADVSMLVPPEYFEADDDPEAVVVLGWGPLSLMQDLIKELDHGLSALPEGSEVTFVNTHNPHDSLGQALENVTLENIRVRHVAANPLLRSSLAAALDLATFRCAIVLCDELWVDPDNNDANGLDGVDVPSVLRLDSLVMVAQLNMRKLLEDRKLPAINVICQKVATEGLTRFEDRHKLPLGISVNFNSYSAKLLAQVAVNPLMLKPATRLGEDAMLTIVDSSEYAALGEELNFWQLMARFQVTGDVLLGYYEVPQHMEVSLEPVIALSREGRAAPRVWNKGDGRQKFILLCHKQHRHGSSSGSHDDLELENTKQAGWVAARERSPRASHSSLHTSHPSSWSDTQ